VTPRQAPRLRQPPGGRAAGNRSDAAAFLEALARRRATRGTRRRWGLALSGARFRGPDHLLWYWSGYDHAWL